jgi:hypothetical protein
MTASESRETDRLYRKPDRLWLGILLFINLVDWFLLCVVLVRRWHAMASHLHFWGVYLAVVFPLLWDTMRREKSGLVSLVGITLAFLGVVFTLSLCF